MILPTEKIVKDIILLQSKKEIRLDRLLVIIFKKCLGKKSLKTPNTKAEDQFITNYIHPFLMIKFGRILIDLQKDGLIEIRTPLAEFNGKEFDSEKTYIRLATLRMYWQYYKTHLSAKYGLDESWIKLKTKNLKDIL